MISDQSITNDKIFVNIIIMIVAIIINIIALTMIITMMITWTFVCSRQPSPLLPGGHKHLSRLLGPALSCASFRMRILMVMMMVVVLMVLVMMRGR